MDIDTYLDIDTHTHVSLSLSLSLSPSLPFSLFSLYTLFAQFFHNISLQHRPCHGLQTNQTNIQPAGGPDPCRPRLRCDMRQGWHGPHVDEEGREYFANSELGVSSWTDPRQETQCPGCVFFFLMFFVMLDGCVSKLVEPDNSPVDFACVS